MPSVFIGYRWADSAGWVGRLAEALSDRFGKNRVYQDLQALAPGDDFPTGNQNSVA